MKVNDRVAAWKSKLEDTGLCSKQCNLILDRAVVLAGKTYVLMCERTRFKKKPSLLAYDAAGGILKPRLRALHGVVGWRQVPYWEALGRRVTEEAEADPIGLLLKMRAKYYKPKATEDMEGDDVLYSIDGLIDVVVCERQTGTFGVPIESGRLRPGSLGLLDPLF